MWRDFRNFITRGNVLDMALGIIIGAAFGTIVNSLVRDVIMPPVGWALGNVDFSNLFVVVRGGKTPGPYTSLAEAQAPGAVSSNYGMFVNTIVSFIIVAVAVFFVVRLAQRVRQRFEVQKEAPTAVTKDCPYCLSKIHKDAKRCAFCTSEVQ